MFHLISRNLKDNNLSSLSWRIFRHLNISYLWVQWSLLAISLPIFTSARLPVPVCLPLSASPLGYLSTSQININLHHVSRVLVTGDGEMLWRLELALLLPAFSVWWGQNIILILNKGNEGLHNRTIKEFVAFWYFLYWYENGNNVFIWHLAWKQISTCHRMSNNL